MNAQTKDLQEIGQCSYSAIADMVEALECNYDRLEELTDKEELGADEQAELTELKEQAGECKDRDDAETRIQEDPLEIQVRSNWHAPGSDDNKPGEFYILLTTGGPAARIMGELDEHGQPDRAWLEVQDWFQPWTMYLDADQDVLLTYCRQFYFGE